jgi:hypothetical protein
MNLMLMYVLNDNLILNCFFFHCRNCRTWNKVTLMNPSNLLKWKRTPTKMLMQPHSEIVENKFINCNDLRLHLNINNALLSCPKLNDMFYLYSLDKIVAIYQSVIRSRKSKKNRSHNHQKKRDEKINNSSPKTTQTIKYCETWSQSAFLV